MTISVLTVITDIGVHGSLLCARRDPEGRGPLPAPVTPVRGNVPIARCLVARAARLPAADRGSTGSARSSAAAASLFRALFTLVVGPRFCRPCSPLPRPARPCVSARRSSSDGKRRPPCAGKRAFRTTGSRWEKRFLDVFPESPPSPRQADRAFYLLLRRHQQVRGPRR